MFGIWSLGQKAALFRHFSTFFQLRSPTMHLQKGKKLAENSSLLPQAPNPKHALKGGFDNPPSQYKAVQMSPCSSFFKKQLFDAN
jgi:hypothetical protein